MMKKLLVAFGLMMSCAMVAQAANVSKSYSYFTIRGTTLKDFEREISKRGPQVKSSGARHPGATRMEFKTRLDYESQGKRCSIAEARVRLKANIILPRWKRNRKAGAETAMIWDTLAADIKRHEESHVIIAKNHARELEQALRGRSSRAGCEALQAEVKTVTERIMAKHDEAQQRFDRVESKSFERRMLGLLRYRVERSN